MPHITLTQDGDEWSASYPKHFAQEKKPLVPIDWSWGRRLVGPERLPGHCGEEKNLALKGIEPKILSFRTCNLVTILTELFQLQTWNKNKSFFFSVTWLISLKEAPGLIPPWKLFYPKLNNSSHFKLHSKNWQAGKWTCSTSLKFCLYLDKILLRVDSPFLKSKLGHTSWLFMTFKNDCMPKDPVLILENCEFTDLLVTW